MSEDPKAPDLSESLPRTRATVLPWYRQQLFWLVIGAIVISLIMTAVSLQLYKSSGAAQVDLSRQDYRDVRENIEDINITTFSAEGTVEAETVDEFLEIYDAQIAKTKTNQFKSDALSDTALGLEELGDV